MRSALEQAKMAADEGEIPIGAVVVCADHIIATGHNMTERLSDPTAHAEMIALTAACNAVGGKYLTDCTIYVTVEPCPMCAGAIINARLGKLYYGAKEPQSGSCGSVINLFMERYGHSPKIVGGVCESECAAILREFFTDKR